jgi:hypothetical protein
VSQAITACCPGAVICLSQLYIRLTSRRSKLSSDSVSTSNPVASVALVPGGLSRSNSLERVRTEVFDDIA